MPKYNGRSKLKSKFDFRYNIECVVLAFPRNESVLLQIGYLLCVDQMRGIKSDLNWGRIRHKLNVFAKSFFFYCGVLYQQRIDFVFTLCPDTVCWCCEFKQKQFTILKYWTNKKETPKEWFDCFNSQLRHFCCCWDFANRQVYSWLYSLYVRIYVSSSLLTSGFLFEF